MPSQLSAKVIPFPSPQVSLRTAAKECMHEANWDVDKARRKLAERIARDKGLMQEAIEDALHHTLAAVTSEQRQVLARPASAGSDDTSALRRLMERSYLDQWICSGKKLGDASPDDIRESIRRRSSRVTTLQRYVDFETAILKQLRPRTRRVRDVLGEDEVRRIAIKHLKG